MWLAMFEGVCVSCIELHLKAPEPAMMGALALAVRAHCCMWAHAGALHAGAHAWDPFPGGLVWLLRCTSFSSALGALLLFRTGTGRGVMREAMALSGKEIGLGRETDLDLKPGSFTFSF